MIKYYVVTTIFIWLFVLFGNIANKFVIKREMKSEKAISRLEHVKGLIQVAFLIAIPVLRWSMVIAVYAILFYSDEKLQEIVDKSRKEK